MSGMTYTAPTVTKLQWQCEALELPMNAWTSDRRNSRLTSELPTLSIFWKLGNWVEVCEVSELPMHAKTSDRRNSRLTSELPTLKAFETSRWPLVMTTTVNSPSQLSMRCQNSQPLPELPTVETFDSRRNSRWTNPRTIRILSWLGTYWTRPVSILPDQQNTC